MGHNTMSITATKNWHATMINTNLHTHHEPKHKLATTIRHETNLESKKRESGQRYKSHDCVYYNGGER